MRAAAKRDPLTLAEAAGINLPDGAGRLQRTALIVGIAGLAVCGLGAFVSPDYFFRSWLVGWVYWAGVALGCLALSLLHHLTHGDWGIVLRRTMEAATRTLPALLLLGAPLLFGLGRLYLWARPEAATRSAATGPGAVPERAVLPGPLRPLFHRSGAAWRF